MPNPLNATKFTASQLISKRSKASNFAGRALSPPVLVASKYLGSAAKLLFSILQSGLLTATRSGSLPTPNTTITSTITVTDQNGIAVSNLSICTLVVTFPDGSTSSTLSLGGGITNIGSGQYQANYNTKVAGVNVELWTVTANDGVTIAQFRFEVGIGY